VLTAGLVVGAWAVLSGSGAEDAGAGNGPTALVTRGSLVVSVTENGEVRAEKRTVIANEIRWSVVIKSLVDEGERVKKGDTIIEFECRELIDSIESKKLAVTNARNAHTQAAENVQLEEKEVANLVRKAEQAVQDAKDDLRRYIEAAGPIKLSDANSAISTAKRDLALAEHKLNFKLKVNADKELNSPFSENEIEAEKLQVEKLKLALGKAISAYNMLQKYDDPREQRTFKMAVEDAELALSRARHDAKSKLFTATIDRDTKKATLDLQDKQLTELEEEATKLVIKAEEEGLVVYDTGGSRWRPSNTVVEIGAKIPSRQQLMIIPDMTTLLIRTKVYEAIIDQVKVGQKAHVRFDTRPDITVGAHVTKVGVLPDSQHGWLNPDVKVFKVDVKLDEDLVDLKPGMTAQVEIELDRLADVLSVPVAAVFTEQEKTYCYTPSPEGPKPVEVTLGRMNETRVQVLAGLAEGDRVLLAPPPALEGKERKKKADDEPADPEGKEAEAGRGGTPDGDRGGAPGGRKPGQPGQGRKPSGPSGEGRGGARPGGRPSGAAAGGKPGEGGARRRPPGSGGGRGGGRGGAGNRGR